MLHAIFSTMPFFVCLFWSVILCKSFGQPDRAKRALAVVSIVSTVLYYCHMYYFLEGDNTIAEGLWMLCSLIVYPLYNIYIIRLTSDERIGKTLLIYLLPALIVAISDWCGFFSFANLAHRVVMVVQLVFVGYFGYSRLTRFDRELNDVYSDSDNLASRPLRTLLMWFIVLTIASAVFVCLGRRLFRDNDLLLAVPSLLFSVLLYCVFYVGYRRCDALSQLRADLDEAQHGTSQPPMQTEPVSTSDPTVEAIAAALQQIMTEQRYYLHPNIKIVELAHQIGTCRTYLSNYINQELGMTFSEYINSQRIAYAKQLLAGERPPSISQAATLSGFSSVVSFSRNFKRFEGLTPEAWLNSCNHSKKVKENS